ncbi:UvrD-helicase domain-containing protein [Caulobacter sp. UNC279MFTsu5.1]|uniref:UvrD-helicase domain-containing protein n=1 Tax=Caulobacter sp. UNC279MFTsu5.1 TaxID=1502775 RepID=UPI000365F1B7|nr:UvrD-helicase domain-containing protein [Caulobacter sp. UNC279MFTsu5.1]SFJ30929.1 Part of AAA domain-containing protein [Caulobacter sp. UNC279MFTsu5.1]
MSLAPRRAGWDTIQYGDDDFRWAAQQLGLPDNAFLGEDGADARRGVLAHLGDLDVAACPGSGKTTLLVAKLALMLRDWQGRGQGICVISHTNVARHEIETRLAPAAGGHRLLAYPHFVGTIHGFVNQFLAGPALRSQGIVPRFIDDAFANRVRTAKLPFKTRSGMATAGVELGKLQVLDADGDLGDVKWGRGNLRKDGEAYQALRSAFVDSMAEGYLRYDEIFLWAESLLARSPSLLGDIRRRFPIVFIDEVQDTTEPQARILHRLFTAGEGSAVRQRFGDMNQAIFGHADASDAVASTDAFPRDGCAWPIANSHRFCSAIAALADPVAPKPAGLVGMRQASPTPGHAIFLFERAAAAQVLPTFARRILAHVPAGMLKDGRFKAIGHVHKPRVDGSDHLVVGDYCPGYDHERSGLDPRPTRFVQALATARSKHGDVRQTVDQIAGAVLHLARLADPNAKVSRRERRHLEVLDALGDDDTARRIYLGLVELVARGRLPADEQEWAEKWVPRWTRVAAAIAGCEPGDVGAFLDWTPLGSQQDKTPASNTFSYAHAAGKLEIDVGSIHAAKGETHTATLVLETFYRGNNLARLKPWLLGARHGDEQTSATIRDSLKQHYVAMTRPSHLLCMAMDAADFSDQDVDAMIARQWAVARVSSTGEVWL